MNVFRGVDFYRTDDLLSEDERMVRDTVREWVSEKAAPIMDKHFEEATFPIHLIPEMAALGLFGANLPEEYGCAGMNNVACGLALSGHPDEALVQLRQALQLRPDLAAFSRQDSDLSTVRSKPEYRTLYAPEYWWAAMEAGPQAEAMADQFVRTLAMFREAVKAFPADEWRKGDTPYQRPAGLALHAVEAMDDYAALKPGESGRGRRFNVDWEEKDSQKLPSQKELLAYLGEVEQRLAHFLAEADLAAGEELFRWTGSTLLSRMTYVLRHTQHHLAEMCLELHRRGHRAPQWQ